MGDFGSGKGMICLCEAMTDLFKRQVRRFVLVISERKLTRHRLALLELCFFSLGLANGRSLFLILRILVLDIRPVTRALIQPNLAFANRAASPSGSASATAPAASGTGSAAAGGSSGASGSATDTAGAAGASDTSSGAGAIQANGVFALLAAALGVAFL